MNKCFDNTAGILTALSSFVSIVNSEGTQKEL